MTLRYEPSSPPASFYPSMCAVREVFVRGSASACRWLLFGALGLAMAVGWPSFVPPALAQGGPAVQASVPGAPADDLAIGVIVDTTDPRSMHLAQDAGFSYAKMIIQW